MICFNKAIETFEVNELLEKVTDPEVRGLVDTLMHEPGMFTRGGRMNKSALCRRLKLKTAQLDELLARLRNQFITEDVPLFRFQVLAEQLLYDSHVYIKGEVIKVYAVTKKLKRHVRFKRLVQLEKSA
ncbi:MAG TPA: hypothetical protein VFG04_14120 [Planctomycetaceae bacterium]|jgi:hypothetical protein|nr:hypothetical protein [Planctomycetaceae bacterium]